MSFAVPKPKRETADEVVLSRHDWEQVLTVLDAESDAGDDDDDDVAAVMAAQRQDASFGAQLAPSVETTIPLEVIKAKLGGVHPLRAWRDHRGWTQTQLSVQARVARDLIAQLETRKKIGSVETLSRLAGALNIPIEAVVETEGDRG